MNARGVHFKYNQCRSLALAAFLASLVISAAMLGVANVQAQTAVSLKVGTFKQSAQTPSWAAKKLGFYEKRGLGVELIEFRNGQEAIAALQSGSIDIIPSTPGTAMVAQERGFKLAVVSQIEVAHSKAPDTGSIQVLKDSPVQSLADLAGKKIAIAALRAPPHLGVKMLLERAGVDLKTVTFLEMPYGAQVDALRGKQIDALATVDPFTTQLRISGLGRVISWNYVESVPEQPLGAFYTRTDYAARNEAVLDKFVGALHEAMDYLNADETRARVLIAEYSGLDPKLLAEMPLNAWDYRIKPEVWQRIVDMLVANAELQSAHKVDDFLSDYIRARLK